MPLPRRNAAVPPVATMPNPSSTSMPAVSASKGVLSRSLIEKNTLPPSGSCVPAAICALRKACGNETSHPITSPVERISGPRIVSMPGNLANGMTASLTENHGMAGSARVIWSAIGRVPGLASAG